MTAIQHTKTAQITTDRSAVKGKVTGKRRRLEKEVFAIESSRRRFGISDSAGLFDDLG